ncbi:hypothetical protein ACE6H2_007993 [Prunus campanulata]
MEISCELCQDALPSQASLTKHKELVHLDKFPDDQYRCYLCTRRFECKKGFVDHAKKLHREEFEVECKCPCCRRIFFSREDKEVHQCDKKTGSRV